MKKILLSLVLVFLVLGIASYFIWDFGDSGSSITSAVTVNDEREADKVVENVSTQIEDVSEEVKGIGEELEQ